MARNPEHVKIAFEQLRLYGKGRDSLPYSGHFDDLYEEFVRLIGFTDKRHGLHFNPSEPVGVAPPSRHEYWLTICAAAKKGGLSEGRKKITLATGEPFDPCEGQAEFDFNQICGAAPSDSDSGDKDG